MVLPPPTFDTEWTSESPAAPLSCRFKKPNLQLGAEGLLVLELRKLLVHWGISVNDHDSHFNLELESAVKQFQRQVFLPDHGSVDLLTWQALYKGAPITMPTLQYGRSGEPVFLLQHALRKIGDYTGAIDGKFGEQTDRAVRSFQRRRGLVIDGIVGSCTWRSLSKIDREPRPCPPPPLGSQI